MKQIPLTEGYVAIVDDEDYAELSKYTWCVDKRKYTCYALRNQRVNGRQQSIRMHRVILKCRRGQHVDHKDGNGLNNTRGNLRIATKANNAQNCGAPITNTSGFKGVYFVPRVKKFHAGIRINGKQTHLGLFKTPEEAHAAYCAAAIKYHGEFARF